MDFDNDCLLLKISSEDKECGRILEDAGITEDDDIQALCYEALKDVFPGKGKKIVQRSKVWNIIQKSLKSDQISVSSSPYVSSRSTCSDLSIESADLSSVSIDNDEIMEMPISKPTAAKQIKLEHSESTVPTQKPTAARQIKLEHPEYTVYADSEILAGAKTGNISEDARKRLIRATIHNMTSAAACLPFCRLPKSFELEEMSKSLVIAYPCLWDADTGHGTLLKQLKRRLSNSQPTRKPQGPCPNKRKNREGDAEKTEPKVEPETCPTTSKDSSSENKVKNQKHSVTENKNVSHQDECSSSNYDCDGTTDNDCIMRRHYKAIAKEMEKKKPNVDVVHTYLNKEFQARRDWLQQIAAEERCYKLLDNYTCFKDHIEVIEEARRVLDIETKDRCQFMNECVGRLKEEVDLFIYFGISKGIAPPKGPRLSTKIVHLLQHLSSIFARAKPAKKAVELIHELKNHDDPASWNAKRMGNVPVITYDEAFWYVIVGKRILLKVEAEKFLEAVVAFLSSFYLLDFDYPTQNEIGMTILQVFVFNDNRIPEDITIPVNGMLKAYRKYKAEAC